MKNCSLRYGEILKNCSLRYGEILKTVEEVSMAIVAIRGATTIDADSKEQIVSRSIELFSEILKRNSLLESDLIYVHATTTADITAYYPVTALRLAGCEVPMFSSLEPPIKGSLPLCIRFLVLTNEKNNTANHIYLHKAEALRRSK